MYRALYLTTSPVDSAALRALDPAYADIANGRRGSGSGPFSTLDERIAYGRLDDFQNFHHVKWLPEEVRQLFPIPGGQDLGEG